MTISPTHIFLKALIYGYIHYGKTIIFRTGLTGNCNDPRHKSLRATNILCYFVNRSRVCFVGRQNKTVVCRCCYCSSELVFNNTIHTILVLSLNYHIILFVITKRIFPDARSCFIIILKFICYDLLLY